MSSLSKQVNSNERMKHLLSSGEDADIQFLVGDGDGKELLHAHKLILKHGSDVFEAMFRFDSQNAKAGRGKGKTRKKPTDSPVEVPDVEAAAFKVMLSFIYADDLSELDGDNAMAVLYAAKKYGIDRLVNECLQIPIPQLSNVFLAFAQARLFDLEDFSYQCLHYICQNADELFESEEFLQIDQNLLCELFDRDQLMITDEFDLWQAALRWADEKCRQNAIECSSENRRAALGPALFKIRFPLIPSDAFVKQIVPSGVLSNDEFVGVFQFHCHPNFCGVPGLYPLKFPTQTRISDWNISMGNRGTLTMEIEKFSEFAREEEGREQFSDAVGINGFQWKIQAKIKTKEKSNDEKCLGFYLLCTTVSEKTGRKIPLEKFMIALSAVEVPDVEPTAFRVMLSFIYADDLSALDGENAMAVLYAAKKYGIDRLVNECLQIPIPKLSNVFLAFAQARLFEFEDFACQCLRFICQNARQLFESVEFLQIDQKLLCEIFDCDQLVISNEFEIWKAALRWSDWKCLQNAIECSAENRRAALGPALFKIRFPLIPSDAFVKQIVSSGVLSNDEFVGVFQFHCHPNFCGVPGLYPLKFPTQTRISDWNISMGNRGTVTLEIEKFSEFAREEEGREQFSDAVGINGFQWKIQAKIKTKEKSNDEKCLGFYLLCTTVSEKIGKWSCKYSATYRIVSLKSGTENSTGKVHDRVLNNEKIGLGFGNFIVFAELMDPCKGFYDKNEDRVTLAVDIFVEEENMKKFDLNPNKSNGTIEMEIDKLSEFAREIRGSERSSETLFVKGISWKMLAEIRTKEKSTEKCLALFIWCTASEKDPNWSCKCSATLRIVSQKCGTKDLVGKFNARLFYNKNPGLGFANFITFAELMDPRKGLYDKGGDKVTFAIDVCVEEENKEKFDLNPNKSNGTIEMEIDKLSEFVQEVLLSERSSETVFVKRIPWKMLAQIIEEDNEKYLVFYLECSPQKDSNWSCECSATTGIVSQKSKTTDGFTKRKAVFSAKTEYRGFDTFMAFTDLIDPSKGFYDKEGDKVTLAIDFTVDEEKVTKKRKLSDK